MFNERPTHTPFLPIPVFPSPVNVLLSLPNLEELAPWVPVVFQALVQDELEVRERILKRLEKMAN